MPKNDILMKKADYVIATGGQGMVRAAYSSGTPAFGVGAGNSVSVVEEGADLDETAKGIMLAETNDWGAGCSTENSIAIQETIYDEMIAALKKVWRLYVYSGGERKTGPCAWKNGN